MEKKRFENPELTIIYFEDDMATEVVSTSGDVGDWPEGDWED